MSVRFKILVLVASSVVICALTLATDESAPESTFRMLGFGFVALSGALLGFERLAWRWPLVRWAVRRPDLHGTWQGTLVSDFEGVASRHEVFSVVYQTFATLRVSLLTRESQSHAVAASVVETDGRIAVFYVYRNEPRLEHQERSRPHRGAVQLWVGGDGKELTGEYWTDRRTTGSLALRLISRRRAGSWEEAVGLGEAEVDGGELRGQDGGRREGLDAVGSAARREKVPAGLVDALAEAVSESEKARMIALRAGFPAGHLPEFKSAAQYWSAVLREAAQGRVPVRRVVEEVIGQFPHNQEFRRYAAELGIVGPVDVEPR